MTESEFPTATDEQISDVLARTHAAFATWRRVPMAERSEILLRVAQLHKDRAAELADADDPRDGQDHRRGAGRDRHRRRASTATTRRTPPTCWPTSRSIRATPGTAWVRKAPVGPLLGIMPWNFPFYQVARFAGPNLMTGNTIVLKHAPQCPESALAMEAIFAEAGLPADAFINVFATNEQIADVIADPRISGVSVTGSERAGTAVAALAGQHLKKVVLELGGSDPFIVLDTPDVAKVAEDAVGARMENAGQACNAAKRFIVLDSLYDEFVERFTAVMAEQTTGDPTDPATTYGPLSSEQAAVGLVAQIDDAVSKGAKVHVGGHRVDRPGAFVEATVLTDVTPDMRAFREELFGPVAVIYRAADVDAAVELANDTPFGLGGVVYSGDEKLAMDVADRLDVGMVWINEPEGGGADLPFGGTKRSGVGRELGPLGIDEFVNKKLIHIPAG